MRGPPPHFPVESMPHSRLAAPGLALVLAAGTAVATSRSPRAASTTPPPADAPAASAPTRVAMRNVRFYVAPDVVLHIRRLDGSMQSRDGGPVVFDDKRSFVLRIDTAEVGLTGKDLGALMNGYVFKYRGSPLSHLSVTTSGSELVQKGRLRKGVEIPFEIHARVSVTPEGLIRLHPTKTLIFGVDGDALMRALGLSLEKMMNLRGSHGASVKGNDILLRADSLLPPPAIEGRVVAVRVEGEQLVQTFGPAAGATAPTPLVPPDGAARAFMYYRGGSLRFGKLTMLDAEMQIVGMARDTTFGFDLDRYTAQLVAGYSRTLSDQGLEVFMRDVDDLATHAAATPASPYTSSR